MALKWGYVNSKLDVRLETVYCGGTGKYVAPIIAPLWAETNPLHY